MSLQLATLEDIQSISDKISSLEKILTEKRKNEDWPELVTPGKAAEMLQVDLKTLRSYDIKPRIEPPGRKKATRYFKWVLAKWVEDNTTIHENLNAKPKRR